MHVARLIRSSFAEKKLPYTLFCITLMAHLIVFIALLSHYGPYSSFLSTNGSLTYNDTQHYVIIADNLAQGHGYSRFVDPPYEPDGLRTPLLVLYFLPFTYIAGLQLIWLAILLLNIPLSLAPVVLYKIGRFFLSHTFAAIAAFGLVCEPLFLYRSQIAEPDALLVLLVLLTVYFLIRFWKSFSVKYLYIVAALLGISILAKPTAIYIAVLVLLFHLIFLIFFQKRIRRKDIIHIGVGAFIVCAVISPWLIRNHQVFGVWGISSITGYNLYVYYTADIKLPNEQIPTYIQNGSREPDRYLPFQKYFIDAALARIKVQPFTYLREQAVGTLRNLFVSDLPDIYYNGQSKILPFSYNPESGTDIRELLRMGNIMGALHASLTSSKVLWVAALLCLYCFACWGLYCSYRRDRFAGFVFTFFLVLFAYLLVSAGTFVDAKYRMPALPLIAVISLYGISSIVSPSKKREDVLNA